MITLKRISEFPFADDNSNLNGYYTPCYDSKSHRNVRISPRFWLEKLNELKRLL